MKLSKLLILPMVVALLGLGFESASAQTVSPMLQIQLATNGLTSPLSAGAQDAVIARLRLDTAGSVEPIRITGLPFRLFTGSGANAATLYSCQVYNEANTSVALNTFSTTTATSTTALSAGLNTVTLDSPLILAPNTQTVLSLRCDVNTDLVAGGTYTFSMNTADVVATGTNTGLQAIVTIPGAAVIPPVTPPIVPPATPGMPATGAGGEATQNAMALLSGLAIAGLGYAYSRSRKVSA